MAVFNEPNQWEHPLGNNADTSTLPDDAAATAGIASLQKLFQIINATPLEAGGIAPGREDFNALFKVLGDSIFYAMNGGFASYNAAYDYAVGRFVVYNNTLYKCIQANGASSTVVAPDSVSPLGSDYWKDIENPADLALKADTDFSNINTSAKITIAHNSMPSGVYDELTVGASGSTYTAPADGYFSAFNRNARDGAVILTNLTSKMQITSPWIVQVTDGSGFVPVKKGDRVTLAYTGGEFGSVEGWFVFIYAVGSESEQ